MSDVRVKRVYAPQSQNDGVRVLVDRLWPRGLTRDEAAVDLWLKGLAPSAELRRWFGHDPERWPAFQNRYHAELAGNPVLDDLLRMLEQGRRVTLLFGAKDTAHNNAVALQNYLAAMPAKR